MVTLVTIITSPVDRRHLVQPGLVTVTVSRTFTFIESVPGRSWLVFTLAASARPFASVILLNSNDPAFAGACPLASAVTSNPATIHFHQPQPRLPLSGDPNPRPNCSGASRPQTGCAARAIKSITSLSVIIEKSTTVFEQAPQNRPAPSDRMASHSC
jgi:hypothetical protein